MTRYVMLLLVIATFIADIYNVSLGHALTWMLGIITGLTLGAAWRDDE